MVERRQLIWPLLAALLTSVALSAPAPASAQEDGVTVDPNSPSGHEYDIPTDRARRDAGGKKKSEKNDKAPLFGQGVGKEPTATPTATATASPTPTSTASAAAAKKAKARREAARRKKAREAKARKEKAAAAAATPTPTPSPPPSVNAARVSDTGTGGGSSWALIGGMAVGLVIVGTGGGLVLHRRFGTS